MRQLSNNRLNLGGDVERRLRDRVAAVHVHAALEEGRAVTH